MFRSRTFLGRRSCVKSATSDRHDESILTDNNNDRNTDEVEFLQSVFSISNDHTNDDGMEENYHDDDSANGGATFQARSRDKSDVFHIFQNLH